MVIIFITLNKITLTNIIVAVLLIFMLTFPLFGIIMQWLWYASADHNNQGEHIIYMCVYAYEPSMNGRVYIVLAFFK